MFQVLIWNFSLDIFPAVSLSLSLSDDAYSFEAAFLRWDTFVELAPLDGDDDDDDDIDDGVDVGVDGASTLARMQWAALSLHWLRLINHLSRSNVISELVLAVVIIIITVVVVIVVVAIHVCVCVFCCAASFSQTFSFSPFQRQNAFPD